MPAADAAAIITQMRGNRYLMVKRESLPLSCTLTATEQTLAGKKNAMDNPDTNLRCDGPNGAPFSHSPLVLMGTPIQHLIGRHIAASPGMPTPPVVDV